MPLLLISNIFLLRKDILLKFVCLKNIKMVIRFTVLLISVFTLLSCNQKKAALLNFSGFTQGTTYSIVFETKKNNDPDDLKIKVENILHDFDMSLSLYQDSSILSRINRNEVVVMDQYFTESFSKSVEISKMTGGAFDITVGSLVKAWGFGPDEHKSFTESKRDSLLKLVGMDKISIVNGRLIKSDPDIKLDFNAIAQGYAVDVICDFLKESGLNNFLVEIGGEVRAIGTKSGDMWRIGIDKPFDNNVSPGANLEAIIMISDEALATSGNYRKFYVEDGIKYSHTIDPRTGYPAKNTLLSATIIADDCATADGIATACMVMGLEQSIGFISKNPQFKAFFVFSDEGGYFKTWISPELSERMIDPEN